jgi:hypothetical protein
VIVKLCAVATFRVWVVLIFQTNYPNLCLFVCAGDTAGERNPGRNTSVVTMKNSCDSHFFVLYSAQHQRCGHFIERADFRVVTKDDLFAWSRETASAGRVQPLPLHCDRCSEDVQATHLRIIKDVYPVARTIVPEVDIKHFNANDWILKVNKEL